jgi:hypothetical protein
MEILQERDGLLDTFEIAASAYGVVPDEEGTIGLSRAQVVAVRRALRGLSQKGIAVDMGRRWHDGRRRWGSTKAAERYQERVRTVFGR